MRRVPAQSHTVRVGAKERQSFQVLLGDLERHHFTLLYLSHPTKKAIYKSRSQAKLSDASMGIFSAKTYFLYYFFPSNGCPSGQSCWDFILHEKKK